MHQTLISSAYRAKTIFYANPPVAHHLSQIRRFYLMIKKHPQNGSSKGMSFFLLAAGPQGRLMKTQFWRRWRSNNYQMFLFHWVEGFAKEWGRWNRPRRAQECYMEDGPCCWQSKHSETNCPERLAWPEYHKENWGEGFANEWGRWNRSKRAQAEMTATWRIRVSLGFV